MRRNGSVFALLSQNVKVFVMGSTRARLRRRFAGFERSLRL
jgi:hypothetical protein